MPIKRKTSSFKFATKRDIERLEEKLNSIMKTLADLTAAISTDLNNAADNIIAALQTAQTPTDFQPQVDAVNAVVTKLTNAVTPPAGSGGAQPPASTPPAPATT